MMGYSTLRTQRTDVFHAIKLVVHQFFTKGYINQLISGRRDEIIERIKMDEDEQFFWCMAAVEMDDTLAATLLHSMIVLSVTMRGFSFSSAWMELYRYIVSVTRQLSTWHV